MTYITLILTNNHLLLTCEIKKIRKIFYILKRKFEIENPNSYLCRRLGIVLQ